MVCAVGIFVPYLTQTVAEVTSAIRLIAAVELRMAAV